LLLLRALGETRTRSREKLSDNNHWGQPATDRKIMDHHFKKGLRKVERCAQTWGVIWLYRSLTAFLYRVVWDNKKGGKRLSTLRLQGGGPSEGLNSTTHRELGGNTWMLQSTHEVKAAFWERGIYQGSSKSTGKKRRGSINQKRGAVDFRK